jgi:hypothetical protein
MTGHIKSPVNDYFQGLDPEVRDQILGEVRIAYNEKGRVDWEIFDQIVNSYRTEGLVINLIFESLRDEGVLSPRGGWGIYEKNLVGGLGFIGPKDSLQPHYFPKFCPALEYAKALLKDKYTFLIHTGNINHVSRK